MNKFSRIAVLSLIGVAASVMTPAYAADANATATPGGMNMMGNMKMMEDRMMAMMNEKDPAKRREMMQKNMGSMHDMMMSMKKNMNPGDKDMASRMKMMEDHMGMMDKEMGMMGKSGSAPAKPQDAKPADPPAEHQHQH